MIDNIDIDLDDIDEYLNDYDDDKIDKFKNRLDITFKELDDKNDICIKKINYRIFIMFVLGILLIGVSNILKSFELLTFSEVIKVLYWFSFTYVCEEIIYARRKLIKIKRKCDKVFNAKINIKSK